MNTYDDNFEIPAPDENVVCFYHEYEENGCFSNWYRAEFEYAGKRFTSVEQYMMYRKAITFGDTETGTVPGIEGDVDIDLMFIYD